MELTDKSRGLSLISSKLTCTFETETAIRSISRASFGRRTVILVVKPLRSSMRPGV